MSAFIVKADYGDAIRDNILDDITEGVDAKLDSAEKVAISYMKGFLSSRYDVDILFSTTGDSRDPVLVMYAIDIALYKLHGMLNWRKTPQHRTERYNAAKEWLNMVKNAEVNPVGFPVPADGHKDYIHFGGNPVKNYHI